MEVPWGRQAPYPYTPVPADGRSREAKFLKVFVAVILAIVVILASSFFVMVISLLESIDSDNMGDDSSTWYRLDYSLPPTVETTTVDGEPQWNISARVTQVRHPRTQEITWDSLNASMELRLGGHDEHHRVVDGLPLVPRPASMPPQPMVFFTDTAGDPREVDMGDIFGVVGATRAIQGAMMDIAFMRDSLTRLAIPVFVEDLNITLGECEVVAPHQDMFEWDAVVPVLSVGRGGERLGWDSVLLEGFENQSASGLAPVPPEGRLDRSTVRCYRDEGNLSDGIVSTGDSVRLTGVPLAWAREYHHFTLYVGVAILGAFALPHYFPSPVLDVALGVPEMTSRQSSTEPVCDLMYAITAIDPPGAAVSWSVVKVRVANIYNDRDVMLEVSVLPRPAVPSGTPAAYYVEAGAGDGWLSVGDALVLSGLGEKFVGKDLALLHRDALINRSTLPGIMPGFDYTVHMSSWSSSIRTTNSTTVWDVSLWVSSVIPSTVNVPWSEVNGTILTVDHVPYLGPMRLVEYADDVPDAPVLYFDDSSSDDSVISADDRVIVAAATPDLEEAWVHLEWQGLGLGNCQLPWDLPSSDVSGVVLRLGPAAVDYAPHGGRDFWRLTVNVVSVTPPPVSVPWYAVRLYLFNSTGAPVHCDNQTQSEEALDGLPWSEFTSEWITFVHLDSVYSDANATAGDVLGAVGLPASCAGGRIDVYVEGRLVATVDLPTIIPRT